MKYVRDNVMPLSWNKPRCTAELQNGDKNI